MNKGKTPAGTPRFPLWEKVLEAGKAFAEADEDWEYEAAQAELKRATLAWAEGKTGRRK